MHGEVDREREDGLVALLAWADGTCQGFQPVLVKGGGGGGFTLSHTQSHRAYIYPYSVAGFIWCQQSWRIRKRKWQKKILKRFEKVEERKTDEERRWEHKRRQEDMRTVDVTETVQLRSAKKEEGRDGYPGWLWHEQIKHRVRETTQGLWERRRQYTALWLTGGLRNADWAAKWVRDWYKTTETERMESEGSLCYMGRSLFPGVGPILSPDQAGLLWTQGFWKEQCSQGDTWP